MLQHVTDYLDTIAEHGSDCSSRMHTAAECSCGLADARADAEDAAELLEQLLAAARDLAANWERGDIAGPATAISQILLGVDERETH